MQKKQKKPQKPKQNKTKQFPLVLITLILI